MKFKQSLLFGLAIVVLLVGGLVYYGSNYAKKMVHDQLAEQRIYFPKTEAEGLFPDLQQYAGQQVDNGDKAKAYADQYIKRHIQRSTQGRTYSEISAEFLKNPKDQKLAQLRQTAFMGETLRGILLNAWGWGLVGKIAMYVAWALFGLGASLIAIGLVMVSSRPASKPARRRK